MADIYKGELQDHLGNTVYPHTEAEIVFCADGKTVQDKLTNHDNAIGNVTGKSDSLEVSDPKILATTVATNKLNESLGGVKKFIVDPVSGKITGYQTEAGADSVFPFSSGGITIKEWYGKLNGGYNYITFDTKNLSTMSIGNYSNATLSQTNLKLNKQAVEYMDTDGSWKTLSELTAKSGLSDLDISLYDTIRIYFEHNVAVQTVAFTDIVLK